eukprot:10745557-Prorocentrum_lima.AAC.1
MPHSALPTTVEEGTTGAGEWDILNPGDEEEESFQSTTEEETHDYYYYGHYGHCGWSPGYDGWGSHHWR